MSDCACRSHNGLLTARGLQEAAQREAFGHGVDAMAARRYLDRSGSVSASIEVEDDYDYDQTMLGPFRPELLQLEMF